MQRLGYELENLTLNKRPWELIRDARQGILNLTAQLVAGEARAAALQRDCQEQDHFRIEAEMRAEAAEAAIVSLQAQSAELLIQRDYFATTLQIVQEQRDQNCDALSDLQAQLQAITQEMRDDGDSSLKYWMSKLDMAAGKL